jgi:hypothetical protein
MAIQCGRRSQLIRGGRQDVLMQWVRPYDFANEANRSMSVGSSTQRNCGLFFLHDELEATVMKWGIRISRVSGRILTYRNKA